MSMLGWRSHSPLAKCIRADHHLGEEFSDCFCCLKRVIKSIPDYILLKYREQWQKLPAINNRSTYLRMVVNTAHKTQMDKLYIYALWQSVKITVCTPSNCILYSQAGIDQRHSLIPHPPLTPSPTYTLKRTRTHTFARAYLNAPLHIKPSSNVDHQRDVIILGGIQQHHVGAFAVTWEGGVE